MADAQHLAALHCLLLHNGNDPNVEAEVRAEAEPPAFIAPSPCPRRVNKQTLPSVYLQIIEWLCDNVKVRDSFDQIQEFILGERSTKNRKSHASF